MTNTRALTTADQNRELDQATVNPFMAKLGEAADRAAMDNLFRRYRDNDLTSKNSETAQLADLAAFSDFLLSFAGDNPAAIAHVPSGKDLFNIPAKWEGVTHGILTAFVEWLSNSGYAVGTVNRRLATVRK